jgi:hypothetical protein
MAISTNGAIITRLAGALYGEYLSNASYVEVSTTAPATVAANWLTNDFASKTDLQVATTILTNLGLTSITGLDNWLSAQITAAGSTAAAKGAKLVSILNDYSQMASDATYGSYATSFNAKTDASLVKSQTTGAKGGSFLTADVVAVANATLVLTTGVDTTLVGGAGSDTYTASGTTLTAGDSLVGGAGTDTLSVTTSTAGNTSLAGFSLNSIENLSLQNASTTVSDLLTVNTSGSTGVMNVSVVGSTADVTVSNLAALVDLSQSSGSSDVTLTYASTVTTGTADTQKISLNGASTLANSSITVDGIETFAVTTTGSASGKVSSTTPYAVTIAGSAIRAVTVAGDQAVSLTTDLNTYSTATTVGTFDASTATGAITAIVTADAADKVSISGGSANDTITFNTVSGTVTVVGGAGIDTFTTSQTSLTQTDLLNISGVEKLSLAASSSVDVAKQAAELTNVVYASGTGASTLTGAKSGLIVDAQAAGTSLGVTVTGASTTGTEDSLSINLAKATSTGGIAIGSLTATGVETINVASLGTAATANTANTLTIAGNSVKTVNVSGAEKFTLTQAGASVTKYDATNASGKQDTTNVAFATAGAAVTGGSTGDALVAGAGKDTVNGGAGNDTITAAAGNDVVVGGAGNDSVVGGTGADSLTGGDGNDTFAIDQDTSDSVVGSTDIITDFVSGTDKISVTNSAAALKFIGNFATQADGLLASALAANGGTSNAFFVTGTNMLYIDDNDDGTLAGTDVAVKLEGLASMQEADLLIGAQGSGNSLTITAANAAVTASAATTSGATGPASTKDDTITSQAQYVTNGTGNVDGGAGTDTLVISDGGTSMDVRDFVNIEILDLTSTSVANSVSNVPATFTTARLGAKGDSIEMVATTGVVVTGGALDDAITLATATTSATVDGGAGNDTIKVVNVASTSALNFTDASGTADVLQVLDNTAADLTGSTLTGIETLYLADSTDTVLTLAQLNAFTAITSDGTASATGLQITNAGTISGDADVTTYTVVGGSDITVGAAGQSVTESSAAVTTVRIGGLTYTGTYTDSGTDNDVLVATTGASIAGATASAFTSLNLTGAITMTEAQYDALTTITAAGASDQITIAAAADIVSIAANAAIETYVVGEDTQNAVAVTGFTGAQNLTSASTTDIFTLSVSGTYTGTVSLGTGVTSVLSVATGTNIAGATIDADMAALTIATGGTVSMTAAQYTAFSGTTTAAGTTANTPETIVLTTAGTLTTSATIDSAVETINLANGTNSITLAGTTAHTITGGTGADTLNVAALTTGKVITFNAGVDSAVDRISIANPAITAISDGYVAVTNFNATNDAIKLWDDDTTDVFFTGGTYQAIVAGSNTAVTSLLGTIEITGSNVSDLTAVTAGLKTTIAAALGATGTTTATANWAVILYSGSDAGIYNVSWSDTTDTVDDDAVVAADIAVELVAVLTGVGADALGSGNFYI